MLSKFKLGAIAPKRSRNLHQPPDPLLSCKSKQYPQQSQEKSSLISRVRSLASLIPTKNPGETHRG
ncbi:MAG: hypothetical protein AB3A66_01615 [Nodularia sp. CChRGM 3473]